jgi:hypothetical protein
MKNDKAFKKLIKSVDTQTVPPQGLREKLLERVMSLEFEAKPVLTPFERFLFAKPLRTACIFAIPVSGTLWAVMGSSFAELLSGFLG